MTLTYEVVISLLATTFFVFLDILGYTPTLEKLLNIHIIIHTNLYIVVLLNAVSCTYV